MSQALLRVENLFYDYPEQPVLRGISFEMVEGEKVALIGPNGAGKSTLLLCLSGLAFGRGEIFINGQSLTKKSASRLQREIGLVFADAEDQLFMPTLEEDVAFGPLNLGWSRQQVRQAVQEALKAMGLEKLANRSSHHLSDGEKKRAALATVLSMQPHIWLFDEPSANLDPRSRNELVAIIRSLGGTMIVATHDLDLALQTCGRCLLLDDGRLVADGEASKVLGDRELMTGHGLEVPLRLLLQKQSRP